MKSTICEYCSTINYLGGALAVPCVKCGAPVERSAGVLGRNSSLKDKKLHKPYSFSDMLLAPLSPSALMAVLFRPLLWGIPASIAVIAMLSFFEFSAGLLPMEFRICILVVIMTFIAIYGGGLSTIPVFNMVTRTYRDCSVLDVGEVWTPRKAGSAVIAIGVFFIISAALMLSLNFWLMDTAFMTKLCFPVIRTIFPIEDLSMRVLEYSARVSFAILCIPTVAFILSIIHCEGETVGYRPFRVVKIMWRLIVPISLLCFSLAFIDVAIQVLAMLIGLDFSPSLAFFSQLSNCMNIIISITPKDIGALYIVGVCLKTVAMLGANHKAKLQDL